MTTETYRGQRIDVLPIRLRSWHAQVNGHPLGSALSEPAALRMARKWVDDALWQKFGRRSRPAPQRAAGLPALTVIKGGIDA